MIKRPAKKIARLTRGKAPAGKQTKLAQQPSSPIQEYKMPADLVQRIVNFLNQLPAVHSRDLLNLIEKVVVEQEKQHESPPPAL